MCRRVKIKSSSIPAVFRFINYQADKPIKKNLGKTFYDEYNKILQDIFLFASRDVKT